MSVRGSSSSASGFPPATRTSAAAARAGTGAGPAATSSRAAVSSSGPRSRSGTRVAGNGRSPVRAAKRIATRSDASRRAANRSASAERASSPCAIVDHAQHRCFLARGSEEAERAGVHGEAIRHAGRADLQRGAHRGGLRRRERVQVPEHRPQQPVQAPARELGLRLDAGRAQDVEPLGAPRGLFEQGALADPRLAPHDQGARAAAPRRGHQCVDAFELVGAPDEHRA